MFLTLQIDDQAVFKDHVFQGAYVPYYDAYKGHIFEVVGITYGGHVALKCISDPTVVVDGNVHRSDLKRI
jgi:hypothetical protein